MPKWASTSLLAVLALLVVAASSGVQLDYFRIEKEESAFVLRWQAANESDLKHYELYRKTPLSDDRFVMVQTIRPRGVGHTYEYRDTQVFKDASEMVTYSLEAVMISGERMTFEQVSAEYTSTALRRTWGSIKAMFQ